MSESRCSFVHDGLSESQSEFILLSLYLPKHKFVDGYIDSLTVLALSPTGVETRISEFLITDKSSVAEHTIFVVVALSETLSVLTEFVVTELLMFLQECEPRLCKLGPFF